MATSALEICRKDLYTSRDDLMTRYPLETVEKVIRVREMYQRLISNPDMSQREIVEESAGFHGISLQCAYSDMRIVKELLPMLTESKRAFHLWRYNSMIMETWRRAKESNNLPMMEKTATSYAKYNNVDKPDDAVFDPADWQVQPFIPTDDPGVLGLRRISNLDVRVAELLGKYTREISDIEDIGYEEADLMEDQLFNDTDSNGTGSEFGKL